MDVASLRQLSIRRKAALVFAAAWVLAFSVYFLPIASRTPPTDWAPWAVLLSGGYSAYAGAVIIIEILRMALPRLGIHDDEKHFHWVWIVSSFLFVCAALSYWLTITTYH